MTSKSGKTRVKTQKFIAIAEKLGLTVVPKAGWLRFEGVNKGQRLLVHTGKRGTNCIELVGFESEFAVAHPNSPAKTMTQLIDFNADESLILRNTYKTAKLLMTVTAAEPVAVPAETPAVSETPAETPAVSETPAEPVASVG